MQSNVDKWIDRLDDAIDQRLEASGIVLSNAYKDQIRGEGLIDTGRFINSVTYDKDEREVRAGTPIGDPPYPFFLEVGFRHHQSGEIVGPYRPLTKATTASEETLRAIWSQEIRG